MLQKTNISGYVKDSKTHAVHNRNTGELEQYLSARRKVLDINKLNEKVDKMADDMAHLKSMMTQLLEKVI